MGGQVGIGVAAELFDGGAQLLPGRDHRFARNALAIVAVAVLEPFQVARQAQQSRSRPGCRRIGRRRGRAGRAPEIRPADAGRRRGYRADGSSDCAGRACFRLSAAGLPGAASRSNAALVPGRVEIAPFGQRPGGMAERVERLGAVALLAPGEPRERAHQRGRRRRPAAARSSAERRGQRRAWRPAAPVPEIPDRRRLPPAGGAAIARRTRGWCR